ncbi:MAG: hypothetical protein EOO20_10050 [Chryseobacterium sp.]|nr:MAG: hypothetical protein EOO20_10050 [Chryseobacterium sp.]
MAKRAKIYQTEDVKQNIGLKLKKERLLLGYSFGDIADMTDFSKSTIINLEKGIATNLDYYVGYAKAINLKLAKLFDVPVEYKPKYELSQDKKNRVFLSRKIRKLIIESNLFKDKTTVDDVIIQLSENDMIQRKKLSTDISRILLNWVEDGTLIVAEKKGRKNVYIKC